MKRVMVDQGSGAEIMYLDLYKGLNMRPEDLTAYDSPLVSFDGKVIIPRGQIRLLVQAGGGSRLHRGGRLFPLYGYYSKTLASYLGSYLFYSTLEGEISIGGLH